MCSAAGRREIWWSQWANAARGKRERHVRVLLAGSSDERARLRASLNGALRVVAEFPTVAEAEASGLEADAILAAPPSRAYDEMNDRRGRLPAFAEGFREARRSALRARRPQPALEQDE